MSKITRTLVRRRLLLLLLAGITITFILMIRLGYVQFALGGWLTEEAEDSWSRDLPFEAERGEILDRNGEVLATNVSAPSVLVVPRQIVNPAESAAQLAEILEAEEQEIYEQITESSSIVRINPAGRKIEQERASKVRAQRLPGVYIVEDNKRHYPQGEHLAHVLGFAGIDNQGLTGLEKYYDERLQGQSGYVSFFSDAQGQRLPDMADQYEAPQNGMDVRLTINDQVQTIMERELDIAEASYNPDGALAIAMDPDNGEILGMSSRPHFNPDNYQAVSPEIYNQNRPIWATYEPGSTFKIITLASALEEEEVDLDEDRFHDPGYIEVAGQRLRCWKKGGHGDQTFLEVVQNSCNPGFVALGERLGTERLFDYIHQFGFGEQTGIDMDGEGTGILFDEENVGPLERSTTAFGQGVSVTPIQQVAAVAAAVNGGTLYQPYVAKDWLDPDSGLVVDSQTPIEKRDIISEDTSAEVRRALEHVVAQGTGSGAFVDGYRVGGKTGTAQKAQGGRYLENNHIVSFIGFAPADDPEIVVYVAVDNPKDTMQFGGVVAAPIVGEIIEDSLQAMDVPKRDNQVEKELTWSDVPYLDVPDVTGLTLRELHDANYPLNIEVSGEGEEIYRQSPAAGERVEEGSTIRLYMGDKSTASD
ncbi:stage V sporulation protein D (sporulation-specific penicillin-binding protein) [Geomicrobium halophilum]|uniref:Stage V sporulation protein D (Sporulation-specific penicillin-binding protein) n=1 Tax=Geomicrobium halophilum TaxID=549000 RepID=A0A841PKW8_9BACL|nr:stage V sporulation protein D [Geomicrobium halophilum]MBB6449389.1 stage V sporulation protein D (sporulation-specific penicillin-binding protein) [Geomicrobium halophilum]